MQTITSVGQAKYANIRSTGTTKKEEQRRFSHRKKGDSFNVSAAELKLLQDRNHVMGRTLQPHSEF